MKIDKLYLKDVLEKYEEVTGKPAEYDDDTGLYYLEEINCIIKSWNCKLELNGSFNNQEIFRDLIKFVKSLNYYNWVEFEEKENEKQNDEN